MYFKFNKNIHKKNHQTMLKGIITLVPFIINFDLEFLSKLKQQFKIHYL